MRFLITDKNTLKSIQAVSTILGSCDTQRATVRFAEYQGEDLIFIAPNAGLDGFMIGSGDKDLFGVAPGMNIHSHYRQDARIFAEIEGNDRGESQHD
jgi:hypothetical protein